MTERRRIKRARVVAEPAIRRLAGRLEPALRQRFLRAVELLRGRMSVEEIAQAVISGTLTGSLTVALEQFPTDLQPAVAVMNQAFNGAGTLAADRLGSALSTSMAFDLVNPRAISAAAAHGARMVTAVSDETRHAIADVIGRAFSEGIPPEAAGRLIRPMIGLTVRQEQAVTNYWARLIADGVKPERVNRLAESTAKLLRQRGLIIARTETIRARLRAGQTEAWHQAVAAGLLDKAHTRRRWTVAEDERLCDRCLALDGRTVTLDEPFEVGVMDPPEHPCCRCSTVLVFI